MPLTVGRPQRRRKFLGEEEEELFVFNDTIEGPRAPAVKPGASLKPDESEVRECAAPLSPVVGQSDLALLAHLTTLLPRFDPR